ncbi:hypothetical protein MG290_07555 [Flavobacterium sp. CBA20B-1]|uniref:hypothetical protein n=1 Tax=unclassified Flavobacterium TaxID=196869 RepID=UPI002225151A|nr:MULTISPECIES: hypothetical protein [unclassified Flavobacterium]WCM40834.1 hypothetical protein MG290_07555 [Flavobacterium sp. CBA20B-1]
MKLLKYVFSISILFLLYGCPDIDDVDAEITIINNSEGEIYWWARGKVAELEWQPNENFFIERNSSAKLGYINDGSRLYIWLFDREVIDNTPWEEVVENERYLIRYDLTIQDLEAMNWEIIYTGE